MSFDQQNTETASHQQSPAASPQALSPEEQTRIIGQLLARVAALEASTAHHVVPQIVAWAAKHGLVLTPPKG